MAFFAEDGSIARGRGRKPEIFSARQVAGPLSRKLMAAYLFNEGGGETIFDWSGRHRHLKRSGTDASLRRIKEKTEGRIILGDPASQHNSCYLIAGTTSAHDLALNNSADFTIIWREKHTDTFYTGTNDFNRIVDRATGGTGIGGWALYWDSSGALNRLIYAQANNTGGLDPTGTYINAWRTYCITKLAGALTLYMNEDSERAPLNMTSVDTGTVAGSPGSNTADFRMFNANTTNRPYEGEMAYFYMWNRVLDPKEISQVARDPYKMFHYDRNSLFLGRSERPAILNIVAGRSRIIGGD